MALEDLLVVKHLKKTSPKTITRKSPKSVLIDPNLRCQRIYPTEDTRKNVDELKTIGIKLATSGNSSRTSLKIIYVGREQPERGEWLRLKTERRGPLGRSATAWRLNSVHPSCAERTFGQQASPGRRRLAERVTTPL